jgi:hypothetical protein
VKKTIQLKDLWSNTTVDYDYAACFSRYFHHQVKSLYIDVKKKVNTDDEKRAFVYEYRPASMSVLDLVNKLSFMNTSESCVYL